ncbi:MAG: hypothetical protein B7Y25_07885 [Alphaproteobacteria bacterium 16-39-46]|nr:MAG: hypothetical protein B7Y25_07885 [Alphaproteobacteria bacterium 16-39-46]
MIIIKRFILITGISLSIFFGHLDGLYGMRCLISGFERDKLEGNRKGVVTLCYRKGPGSIFDHVALVFEMFLHESPDAISLRMVHYVRDEDWYELGETEKVMVNTERNVLFKVHRVKIYKSSGIIEERAPNYVRHSSWIISNEDLLEGLKKADTDSEDTISDQEAVRAREKIKYELKKEKNQQKRAKLKLKLERLPSEKKYKGPHTSVEYVQKIMNIIGIETKFSWWWPNTPDHLKWLVDNHGDGKYLSPVPDRMRADLPRYPYGKED